MMEFESDRMTGLVLTDEVVKPELQVILEERNMRIDNDADARLSEQMEAALYLNHPYGRPVIGWRHEMETLDARGRARLLQALLYAQQRDPDHRRRRHARGGEEARRGNLRQGPARRRGEAAGAAAGAEAGRAAHRHARRPARHPAEPEPLLSRPRPTPPAAPARPRRSTSRPTSWDAAPTAGSIRSWWSSSGTAVSAGASYYGTSLDATRLSIAATPKPGNTLAQVEEAIDAVLAELIEKGVTQDELERSRNRLIADAVYAQDSQSTLARWYGASLSTGLTIEKIRTWPDRLRAVTVDDVKNAARNVLDKRRSVTGYLLKAAGSKDDRS